ncbi:DUF4181 domain-containing protein [Rossellomorea aquimaris]|uniref:DUF4181 domain-containing protein n=1 Tax=Rossellomorea aquimaris TaxID=189382 RepID=UPI001CD7A089|nr:DUF4181 domain-containing protein [Rossellomorea aquimaris]MCA1060498.1 DUF4181 domain-containing protein [Rossellomorea aquimaris]
MDSIWLNFFLFLSIYALIIFLFNAGMRRLLNVKRKQIFSYHHLNETHKKVDWTIRMAFVVLIIAGVFFHISNPDSIGKVWYLETHILVFGFILLSESVRAVFEKKHSDNPNDYKFTLAQLTFLTATLLLFFTTGFFGIFT